jgi:uncharacterized protein
MFIDLQKIPPDGKTLELGLPVERLAPLLGGDEFRLAAPVRLNGKVERASRDSFRVRGELETTLELDCVRCLEAFPMPLHEALDLLYLPQSANVGPEDEERGLKEEDLAVAFYQDEKIDLGALVREQVYLALPMKPLCRSDCRGLCPSCGVNRNLSSCLCEGSGEADPRLAGLKIFFKA